jgi:lysophospholipase L1-like esterase
LLIVVATALTFGANHRSSEAVVFGRYSWAYASVLLALAILAWFLAWVLVRPCSRAAEGTKNGYVFFFSLSASILLLEIGLRTVNPWGMDMFHWLPYHMQGMVDHPQLGYVHPRSTSYTLGRVSVSLNSHGLRDVEIPYAKPPGEKRILLLGDSVAFGWGVTQGETVSDRMEPLLSARTGEDWQVINAGVNGYNTEQEEIFLRLEGLSYSPDIVILIYVDNDVEPVFDPNVTTWRRHWTWPGSLPEAADRLLHLSYTYQMVRLLTGSDPRASAHPVQSASSAKSSITIDPRWPRSRASLSRIALLCRETGIPLLVAKNDGFDDAFVADLTAVDVETALLETAWERVPADQRHVSRLDPHPSAEVHAQFAEQLVDELQRRGWLKRRPIFLQRDFGFLLARGVLPAPLTRGPSGSSCSCPASWSTKRLTTTGSLSQSASSVCAS